LLKADTHSTRGLRSFGIRRAIQQRWRHPNRCPMF